MRVGTAQNKYKNNKITYTKKGDIMFGKNYKAYEFDEEEDRDYVDTLISYVQFVAYHKF